MDNINGADDTCAIFSNSARVLIGYNLTYNNLTLAEASKCEMF